MPSSRSSKKPWWLWAGIGGIIVIALGIAIWSSSSSDPAVSEGTVAAGNPGSSSAAETQPVTVDGTALPVPPPVRCGSCRRADAADASRLLIRRLAHRHHPRGGRAKMVVFLAHWCPHCNNEIPVLQSWAAAGGVPPDLDIIGVSTAVSAQRENYPPSEWLQAKQWTWPVLADSAASDAAAAYGVAGFPTFAIVGADGQVKVRSSGELSVEQLDALVNQAVAA